jgi:hypothetical protein
MNSIKIELPLLKNLGFLVFLILSIFFLPLIIFTILEKIYGATLFFLIVFASAYFFNFFPRFFVKYFLENCNLTIWSLFGKFTVDLNSAKIRIGKMPKAMRVFGIGFDNFNYGIWAEDEKINQTFHVIGSSIYKNVVIVEVLGAKYIITPELEIFKKHLESRNISFISMENLNAK